MFSKTYSFSIILPFFYFIYERWCGIFFFYLFILPFQVLLKGCARSFWKPEKWSRNEISDTSKISDGTDDSKRCFVLFRQSQTYFFVWFVTIDETWTHPHIPESNRQSVEWTAISESHLKRSKKVTSLE